MSETWKQWEGRTVDGRFPLQRYLGGSDHSAVFLTRSGAGDSEKAAIKLIAADAANAEKQLLRWKAACELHHQNLIRISEVGCCTLDGTELLYAVEEYAEENLSQILPERTLTAEEARGMLPPILRALQYAHEKRFVHGRIQPSNIMAIGDQVKLSSDALGVPGERKRDVKSGSAYDPPEATTGALSAAADIWQLGMTLVEVLTQRLPAWDRARPSAPEVPASVPEPLREISEHCLQVDARKRWTVAEIGDWLEGKRPAGSSAQSETGITTPSISGQRRRSAKWPYLLGLAALVAAAIFLARPKPLNPPAEIPSTQAQPRAAESAQSEKSQSAQTSASPESRPGPAANAVAGVERASANIEATDKVNQSGVAQQVTPQVLPSARRTIQGKIKIRVRVEVDAKGNVANATLESAGPSKYFSRIAMEAARDWKFSPVQAAESSAREWKLQFTFSRTKTEVSAVRAKR